MAVHLTPRAIVRYGCILLAVVVIYNAGGYISSRKSPSKAETEVAKMLSRQQEMAGDIKDLRALVESLRSDLKSARSAQEESAQAVQQAAGQEAEKQVAAVAADLQDNRAVVAKLDRAAAAQQQQIEALQAKLHVAVNADSQHKAALIALKEEHAKHVADSVRADRSVREEGAGPAKFAASGGGGGITEQRADGGSSNSSGSRKRSNRKHGAALLPMRGKGRESVAGGGAADGLTNGGNSSGDGGGQSLAERAGLRADAAAVDDGSGSSGGSTDSDSSLSQGAGASDESSSGNGSTGKGVNSAKLDQHARQQVMAGRDPKKVVAMHTASDAAPSPAVGPTSGAAQLLDAHAAVLAAKKAEHAERLQQAGLADEGEDLASGSGIAGAVSGMTAKKPTGAPGLEGSLAEDASAVGGLNGAALADAHAAVRNQAELTARKQRGNGGGASVIDAGAAGSLRGQKAAIAPLSAAAAEAQDTARGAEVGARELVQALAKGGGSAAPQAAGDGDSVLEDPSAARAAMLDAAKAVHASRAGDAADERGGSRTGAGATARNGSFSSLDSNALQDAAVAERAAIVAAGKAGHTSRINSADGESGSSVAGRGSGSSLDISSLQRAEANRLAGGGGGVDIGSVFGSSGRGQTAGAQFGSTGGSGSGLRGDRSGAAGVGSSGGGESSSDGDPLEEYAAVLDQKAAADQSLERQGADAVAR